MGFFQFGDGFFVNLVTLPQKGLNDAVIKFKALLGQSPKSFEVARALMTRSLKPEALMTRVLSPTDGIFPIW